MLNIVSIIIIYSMGLVGLIVDYTYLSVNIRSEFIDVMASRS